MLAQEWAQELWELYHIKIAWGESEEQKARGLAKTTSPIKEGRANNADLSVAAAPQDCTPQSDCSA